MYFYFFLSGLINAIVSILFGLLIFVKNKKSKVNQTFVLFCLSVAIWSFPYMFWPLAETKEGVLFWFQALHIGASFTSVAYLHFVLTWLEINDKKNKVVVIIGYSFAIIFASTTFTPYFIVDVVPKFSMDYWANPGILYHLYLIYFFGYFLYSSYLLVKKFRKSSGIKRAQIKLILFGMIIAFAGGSTNYFLWYDINFPPYGNIFVGAYVILTAYAIIKHRLMDIKLVMRKSSVFVLSFISILIPAFIIKYFFEKYFESISAWLDLIVLLLGITLYPFIKKYFFKIANKYFFSSLYDSQKVIVEVSDKLRMILDIEKVYDFIYDVLVKTFHTKTFAVISYEGKKSEYVVQYNKGLSINKDEVFKGNDFLHRYFTEQNKSIIVEEVKNTYYNNKTKKTIDFLEKLKVEVLIPLNVKNKTIGLLVLGPKESADMYNEEDLEVLEVIGAQAAVSIDNARLYSEVKDFNIKLKQKINDATVELRNTNDELKGMNEKLVIAYEKLHQLDRAKTEFISIASHQLRTPLTSIKGFISLLLDGTYGKIKNATRDVLEKVFISNERLIKLVEDLLNISRIESGKLVFRFQKDDITKLAKSMVDSFELAAKNKKLKLEYRDPKKNIPEIYFDYDKMREVISNLIDNSIKYTKKGVVGVTLECDKDNVRVVVFDTGMGIVKGEARYIFEKFQRGKDSSTTHTEGVGLGLYVCEKIVVSHKGKIWAESDGIGKGSKFIVELKRGFVPEDEITTIGEKEGR